MNAKKCPGCAGEIAEADFFCPNCGMDISLVRTGALGAAPRKAAPESPAAPPLEEQRVCPKCGHADQPFFILCTQCGFDLSAANPGSNQAARLFLRAGPEKFECKSGDILGRDGTVARSFFRAAGTVSRQHARLTQRDGRWFVTVLPTVKNITELDGRELPSGTEQSLDNQHVLKLSTQCEVALQVVPG
jgi:hypothetical protein